MDARKRIAVGVAGLIVVLGAAAVVPDLVGRLLMFFALIVFILAVGGLIWPGFMRLPSRLAAVWVFALSFGMFIGGAMLISPQNGDLTASDAAATAADMAAAEREAAERLRAGAACFESNRYRRGCPGRC